MELSPAQKARWVALLVVLLGLKSGSGTYCDAPAILSTGFPTPTLKIRVPTSAKCSGGHNSIQGTDVYF